MPNSWKMKKKGSGTGFVTELKAQTYKLEADGTKTAWGYAVDVEIESGSWEDMLGQVADLARDLRAQKPDLDDKGQPKDKKDKKS